MKKNSVMTNISSTFLSCEKDTEKIIKKLFVTSKPYSDTLKRLLVINNKDCIDDLNNEVYNKKIKEMSVSKLIDQGYIRFSPNIRMNEHEEVKSYIVMSFDNFSENPTNPEFRDCVVVFDVICHTTKWDIGNYRQRPLKIVGYIDGILNGSKLTGIGKFNFLGCSELVLNEDLSGYTLMFSAVHGSDDSIPLEG